MTTIISHDIQSLTATDKINNTYIVKRKLLWGPDGTGYDVTTGTPLPVTFAGPFIPPLFSDAITASYPDAVTEIYEYRQGGVGGTILLTLTVVYTDSLKSNISTVVRS